jgi:hypothetical protein
VAQFENTPSGDTLGFGAKRAGQNALDVLGPAAGISGIP